MQIFIDELAYRHPNHRVVMILDNAGWHKTKSLKIPSNMKFKYLPPYSPELNPVEHIWDDFREKYFHSHFFDCFDSFENHFEKSLFDLENNKERVLSTVVWPWIINALMN
ncbi:MAG: transposase [Nitrospirae bacterium]|nr:transposase [Nitrospirota bacterium]MBF0521278.1 transposase [Nitrospirota bacterium]MBF0533676.1 transposase [Nitrospirota bacterium]MBF0616673.1 transposase [Nitrospirota bacterium]